MKTKNLTFTEAIKAIKEGHKVRRDCWESHQHILEMGGKVKLMMGADITLSIGQILAEDWEILKERKTLSDNIFMAYEFEDSDTEVIDADRVGKKVKEFSDFCEDMINRINPKGMTTDLKPLAKEFFGERLLKWN